MKNTHAMHKYKDLRIWQLSMVIAEEVYRLTEDFPRTEMYGLQSQMRRSAVSIASNIAEGAGRNGPREFNQFVGIAAGSLAEIDTQIQLAIRFGYIDKLDVEDLEMSIEQLQKMIYTFQQQLRKQILQK
jgi:four helix bundle protein